MTTIDHAGALAVSRPDTFSDEHVAGRALQVARRTALGRPRRRARRPPISPRTSPSPRCVAPARCATQPRSTPGSTGSPCAPRCARPAAPAGAARPSAPGHDPPTAALDDDLAGSLALLEGLPARQRAALTLRYVHDLPDDGDRPRPALPRRHGALAALARTRGRARRHRRRPEPACEPLTPTCTRPSRRCARSSRRPTTSPACSALADELRSPRSLAAPRRRAGRAVALVAATAALIGTIAALPGGDDSSRPQDAQGVFQAAAAVAAEQPAPAAYRYTRALERFVHGVNAADGEHGRVTEQQTTENWTSDGWRGRTTAAAGTVAWAAPPTPALLAAAGDIGAVVKPYDGDYRYGDGPLARVPFGGDPPTTPPRPGSCSRPRSATGAGCPTATPTRTGRPAWSTPRSPAARSCCSPWATSTALSARRSSGCSARRPGAAIARRCHRRDRAQGRRRGAAPA